MQIVDFGPETARPVPDFGSEGFRVRPMLRTDESFIAWMHLAPGGRIGRHPAVGRQIFLVVTGEGVVSGRDGVEQPIRAGQAAVWDADESHETWTPTGLSAVVTDGAGVTLLPE